MAKRKQNKPEDDDEDGGSGSDVSLVDVDFDFFDPNAKVDYIALKRLLVQLFQSDAELLPVHELTDLILAQPEVGTTVKTDGEESDPYACLTVLNMHIHQDKASIKSIAAYILQKSQNNAEFHNLLQSLLGASNAQPPGHVGLVFSERLINMPVQVVPHMYRMLADEITAAVDENQPFRFSHYIFLTRTYRLSALQAQELEASGKRPSKRQKSKAAAAQELPQPSAGVDGVATYSFHPEDECIQSFSLHTVDYRLTTEQPRDAESFGLDMGGRLMIVPANRFQELVETLVSKYSSI